MLVRIAQIPNLVDTKWVHVNFRYSTKISLLKTISDRLVHKCQCQFTACTVARLACVTLKVVIFLSIFSSRSFESFIPFFRLSFLVGSPFLSLPFNQHENRQQWNSRLLQLPLSSWPPLLPLLVLMNTPMPSKSGAKVLIRYCLYASIWIGNSRLFFFLSLLPTRSRCHQSRQQHCRCCWSADPSDSQ